MIAFAIHEMQDGNLLMLSSKRSFNMYNNLVVMKLNTDFEIIQPIDEEEEL